MKNSSTVLATVAVLALLLTGCDSTTQEARDPEATPAASEIPAPSRIAESCDGVAGNLRIGLATVNLQALFFNQINSAAQAIADKSGTELQIVSANDDPVAQANSIDNLVTSGVDAIIVAAIDVDGIQPALQRAHDAGVFVVAVDEPIRDPAVATSVGTSNEASGTQIGDLLIDASGGSGTVGIVGALSSAIQLERQAGFVTAVEAGGMSVGTIVDGRNVQEAAQSAAENLLTGGGDMRYVYATGEPALIGLVAAVSSQNAADRIEGVGWDLSEQAVTALRDGWLIAVVQQNTFEFGYEAMNAAIDLACGRVVPSEIPIATQIITPENVDDFLYYLEK